MKLNHRIERILLSLLLPVSVLASLAAFLYCRATGGPVEAAILITSLLPLGLAMVLERLRPHRVDWNKPRGDAATDWVSFAVLAGAVQPLLKWASPLVVVGAYAWLGQPAALFPPETPFALQVLAVTLVAELGKYWVHRWHHTVPSLWWLHSLHHGSERLYAINNFRVHPVEYTIKHAFGLLPLMVLGAPAEAILGYIALTQPVQMLQHVNLPIRHGWLNYIFSTNELHRWHHSAKRGEGDTNFGSALVLWDQVFGTFHYRAAGTEPERIGMYDQGNYPVRQPFHAQVLSIFRPPCCRT